MAEPGASDTRPNLPSIDEILQDLRCTYKEFRCMKGRHSGFGYYKFCPVVESLIRQTIEVAVQVQGHRAVIDDLYEERKWLVAAYKEEAVSNVRVENAYVELQRLMLLEQIHKPDRGVLAVQIGRGLVFAIAVLTLVALLTLCITCCFAIMQMAIDVLRLSSQELILIGLSLDIGIVVTLRLYRRL